jgi:hypothetical protein
MQGYVFLIIQAVIFSLKLHLTFAGHAIVIGGICKAVHYLGENYGVMKGFSYGEILVWPVQTITILLISVFVYKERLKN